MEEYAEICISEYNVSYLDFILILAYKYLSMLRELKSFAALSLSMAILI